MVIVYFLYPEVGFFSNGVNLFRTVFGDDQLYTVFGRRFYLFWFHLWKRASWKIQFGKLLTINRDTKSYFDDEKGRNCRVFDTLLVRVWRHGMHSEVSRWLGLKQICHTLTFSTRFSRIPSKANILAIIEIIDFVNDTEADKLLSTDPDQRNQVNVFFFLSKILFWWIHFIQENAFDYIYKVASMLNQEGNNYVGNKEWLLAAKR